MAPSEFVAVRWYQAPEVILLYVDMWALGAIMAEDFFLVKADRSTAEDNRGAWCSFYGVVKSVATSAAVA